MLIATLNYYTLFYYTNNTLIQSEQRCMAINVEVKSSHKIKVRAVRV